MSNVVINPYSFASEETRFVTKWTLTDPADLDVTLWAQVGGTTLFDVDWGDGATESSITATNKSHTYGSTGTYEIKISGQFPGLDFNYSGMPSADRAKLTELSNWGSEAEIYDLMQMFYGAVNMVYAATDAPDLSNLKAGASARQVFTSCESVTSLDLSGWTDTGNINAASNTFYYTFHGMDNLESVNLTGWDTSGITSTHYCFGDAGKSTADGCVFTLPSLDFSACTKFDFMFLSSKIQTINLGSWTLRAAGATMVSFLQAVTFKAGATYTIDLSGWSNTSGITSLNSAFRGTSGMTSLNLTGWNTSAVTTFYRMFYYCDELTQIVGLNGLNATAATTVKEMFIGTQNLDFGAGATTNFGSNWGPNLGNCTDFHSCFYTNGNTTPGTDPPYVSNWDMSAATTIYQMFYTCKHSGSLDVSSWDVTSLTGTGIYRAFQNNTSTSLNVSSWELSGGITSAFESFRGSSVTALAFTDSNNDFSAVTTWYRSMYSSSVTSLTFDGSVSFAGTTTMQDMMVNTGISTANYDALLLRLDATNNNAVVAHFGSSEYTGGGAVATARASLVTKGWTITDGGIA